MLFPRAVTALVGIPLILAALHTGGLPLAALIAGISLLCLMELFSLLQSAGMPGRPWIGYPAALILFAVFVTPALSDTRFLLRLPAPPLLGFALTMALVLILSVEIFYVHTRSLARSASTLFAVFFAAWPLAHIVLLRELAPRGREWCFFLFIVIWCTDILAYAAGSMLGKLPLAPKVSPKKTVEGFVGGILGALAAAGVLWLIFLRPSGVAAETAILAGTALGVIGQLSDLVESMMKRQAQMKDSSKLLPGHGGILDRFDSFFLTAPLMYYYLVLLGRG